ncbi:hypothetical protein A0H81_14462 [Grifola frondosa]|uniref:Uncharacterized protein n=1 Tax=Grifola frondosa TaxID=5627 RepID=A0A1C7LND5_GRIFR|nr:hypothetical protein A0H81_14462 [Grifola frondosa]
MSSEFNQLPHDFPYDLTVYDMARNIPSAKSGNDWTMNELIEFNIQVESVDAVTFFGHEDLPQPPVSHTILNNVDMPDGSLSKSDRQFFHYLRDAIRASGEESAADDFAAFILRMFNYDEPDRVIHQQKKISFIMAGQGIDATTDLCLITFTDYLLLVQKDKQYVTSDDPEPQLIAEAIAAFYQNNLTRDRTGLPRLPSTVFPGITMIGTAPIFYRIPVTEELLTVVATAAYPSDHRTVVQRFIPPVTHPQLYVQQGLVPLDNRYVVMQCFEAFKSLIN